MKQQVIGVMAGTPVDTQMGVDYLAGRGLAAKAYPVSASPREQTRLQVGPEKERNDVIRRLIRRMKGDGVAAVMVYCNSLSATVDMPSLGRQEEIRIITPLDAYHTLGRRYKKLGVMAATNQGLAGIEKAFMSVNPEMDILGAALLPLVNGIEGKMDPGDLIRDFGLAFLCAFFEANGVEAVLLGCTHFPYLKQELEKMTCKTVLDPTDLMVRLLMAEKA